MISYSQSKQGYATPERAIEVAQSWGAEPAYTLLDEDGSMGQAYGAKTTPHMYIIDAEGQIRYNGAIDTIPTAKVEDLENAQNYVSAALSQMADGGEVVTPISRPYGCSIKYADS